MDESEKGPLNPKTNRVATDEIMSESRPLPSYLKGVVPDAEIGALNAKELASVSYQLY